MNPVSIGLLALGGVACVPDEDPSSTGSTSPDPTEPSGTSPECVPLESAFTSNASPILEARCGECHGAEPQFGAPFSLVSYADLIEGADGERIVDGIVTSLVDGTMPPATAPALSHSELDTLVGWASCGAVHPDVEDGLEASQPVFAAPADPPAGAVSLDITANETEISATTLDDYRTFSFRNLVEEDRFIVRIEPIIDESRVVHHITVRQSSTGRYLYTWAPGTDPIQFPEGGLRIVPNDRLEVEIHYNNGAGIPNVLDSSGMRLWLADVVGTEWGMVEPNTWNIAVPPNGDQEATASCEAESDFTVLAGMPHMHETGDTFRQVLRRSDGSEEVMLELTGWSFEAQYFYQLPFTVNSGDHIDITCGYVNPTDNWVFAGLGTADEMCFNFMYVTPANARLDCPFF